MSEKCYELDDEVVRGLIKVGWLCGMGGDEIHRYVWMYENVGVLGCKIEFVDSFIARLIEKGWIERVNVTRDGFGVFRCVPVEVILGMFESEVEEWIGKVRGYMDKVKVDVDEKWLKSEDRVDMIRLINT